MKNNSELINIVKDKKFKTFWNCLDYLMVAGFSPMDSFGVSLLEFGEEKIFSCVAFIRSVQQANIVGYSTREVESLSRPKNYLMIGLINDNNIHLSGMFGVYRKWLYEGKFESSPEIESNCDIIKIYELDEFLLDYILTVSEKHFGFKAFTIKTYTTHTNLSASQDINAIRAQLIRNASNYRSI